MIVAVRVSITDIVVVTTSVIVASGKVVLDVVTGKVVAKHVNTMLLFPVEGHNR